MVKGPSIDPVEWPLLFVVKYIERRCNEDPTGSFYPRLLPQRNPKPGTNKRTSGLEVRSPPCRLMTQQPSRHTTKHPLRSNGPRPPSHSATPPPRHPPPPIPAQTPVSPSTEARIRPGATNLTALPHVGPHLPPGIPAENVTLAKAPNPTPSAAQGERQDQRRISDRFTN